MNSLPVSPSPSGVAVAQPLYNGVKSMIGASISENTKRAYGRSLAELEEWLVGRPLDDALFAEYLSFLFEDAPEGRGLAPASIGMVVAAVGFKARLAGVDSPVGAISLRALAGIRREGRDLGRGQVSGISWDKADTMVCSLSNGGPVSEKPSVKLRDAAMVALMSDCLLRVSELLSLRVSDLSVEESDGSGLLCVRHSKTDQEGEGAVLFVDSKTVGHVRDWFGRLSGLRDRQGLGDLAPESYVFVRVRRGDVVDADPSPLRRVLVARILKAYGAVFLPEGQRVSTHSLRVGSAQSLAQRGASLVEMQEAGRWKSPSMPASYSRGQRAARGAVARLRYGVDS
ncbi:MAG: tyrosine-type recombinase/integrase [Bacteroidetes bacterium]|nr:tyrosine-type recombinase/integrase [Bacteroidota bacterium]